LFPKKISFRFSDPGFINIMRKTAEQLATAMGFDENRIFDISLLIEEACINAIEHGSKPDKKPIVMITFYVYKDSLEMHIQDSGCGFKPSKNTMETALKTIDSTRGRGLGLMQSLSDDFELSSTPGAGTKVKLIKYR